MGVRGKKTPINDTSYRKEFTRDLVATVGSVGGEEGCEERKELELED
jgi:hypothetical protein